MHGYKTQLRYLIIYLVITTLIQHKLINNRMPNRKQFYILFVKKSNVSQKVFDQQIIKQLL
jgi:hypothetical protein